MNAFCMLSEKYSEAENVLNVINQNWFITLLYSCSKPCEDSTIFARVKLTSKEMEGEKKENELG